MTKVNPIIGSDGYKGFMKRAALINIGVNLQTCLKYEINLGTLSNFQCAETHGMRQIYKIKLSAFRLLFPQIVFYFCTPKFKPIIQKK